MYLAAQLTLHANRWTVLSDYSPDALHGNNAAADLFFLSVGDTISGQHGGEILPISV